MNETMSLRDAVNMANELEGTTWARVGVIQELTRWTAAELAGAVTEALKDESFRAEPEPHRHRITEADRAYAPTIGGEPRHLFRWER